MRPLVRWTIGATNALGLTILRESVESFRSAYPEFDTIICYNNMGHTALLEYDNILPQEETMLPHPLRKQDVNNYGESTGCGWKLCPPRLRPEAHELWLDNDLVICRRIEEIDAWLDGDKAIITEGLARRRMFGVFDHLIKPDLRLCAGLFGLPPGFDFAAAISERLPLLHGLPLGGFDEQGLTASVVSNMPYIMVPLTQVHICEDHMPTGHNYPGYHFVGANRKDWHRGWRAYKVARVLLS
jgi:hypothetical protein